jgi:hypothetical protein
MTDGEMDEILNRQARDAPELDGVLFDRIVASIQPLHAVRPLPAGWVLKSWLAAGCAAIAILAAAGLGLNGIGALTAWDSALIFAGLAIFIWLAADTVVGQMIPGSVMVIKPGPLLWSGYLIIIGLFGSLFPRHPAADFIHAGMVCLKAGLLLSVPVGVFGWLVLRRGFVLNPVAAGSAAGTLGGLAGITMLELHCANLEASHVIVWHAAVIVLSTGCGAGLALVAKNC